MRHLLLVFALFFSYPIYAAPILMDTEFSPLVYNGTRSVQGEFGPMGWIGNCTGTMVAKNVLVTAAHCVSNGKRISFEHRGSGRSYPATCTRHPQVNTSSWFNDYAFCKLDGEVPEGSVLASFKPETPDNGDDLLLNGLGAPNVRIHYWGKAPQRRVSGQDIVTCGPANLGGGDSGGSLLEWTNDRTGRSGFHVVGINSRGGGGCSYFNRISHDSFKNWAAQYERDKGVSLCGFSADCSGGGDPDPDPEGCDAEVAKVDLTLSAHLTAVTELKACIAKEK